MSKAKRVPPAVPTALASASRASEPARAEWLNWLGAIAILMVGWFAYAPALRGEFLWDDHSEIVSNAVIKAPDGLAKIWKGEGMLDYFPLKSSIQWLQWRWWGDHTTGYHATNIALHLLAALLVWRLLAQLGLRWGWLGGMIFALHPLAVESVAWIAELKNVLSLPPLLLAASCYLDFFRTGRRGSYAAALGLFLVAMLCKTSVVMFPLVLLLHAWWQRGHVERRDMRAAAPFFAIALGLGLVTMWFQSERAIAHWDIPAGGMPERLGRAGMIIGFYFLKSIAPINLLPVYPREAVSAGPLWQIAAWLAIGGVLFWAWKNRQGGGRHALLGLGWFLLNLLPVLGLIKMAFLHFTWVADHFAYVSLVGVVGLAVAAIPRAWTLQTGPGRAVAGAAALAGAFCLVQTRGYAANFASEERLWRAVLERNPQAWLAQSNLAAALLDRKDFTGALTHAQEALRLKPDYDSAHYNATMALIQLGRLDEALRFTAEADARRMPAADLHINLGAALLRAGRVPEALAHYENALRAQPASPQANRDYAVALFLAGRVDESLRHYERALPAGFDAGTHANYGLALAHAGRRAEALKQYEQALRLEPASPDAHYNYALTLIEEGRKPEAENALRAALRFRPDFAAARDRLRELQATQSTPP